MRIIHVVPRDGYGGVESAARSMAARETLACDFKLLFITGRTLAPDCARITTSAYERWYHPGAYRQAYSKIRAFAPDVAVFSLWRSVPLLIALRVFRPRIRIVFTINSEHRVHSVETFLVWCASRLADEIWCDSETTLAKRVRQKGRSGRVISFVTEGSRRKAIAAALPVLHFICWARLDPQKGLDRALRLIAALSAIRSDVRLDVYGPDDGDGASLQRLSEELALGDQARFHPPVAQAKLADHAKIASFFLLPSRGEGMAMACVEAMQMGLIPVVTAVGEMKNYVRDGENGLIIDPDALDDCVAAILALVDDQDRYKAMQRAAVETWDNVKLYADDFCQSATELKGRRPGPSSPKRGLG